ncbi:lasso peptide biosynthesis B2 protein [Dyadobacter aurulentus]|uniref:lasso peptide biosynthesis B2 protein n=1 Tax=Dyadobacter sp. UC 10 TaxID=2605428 RepID=UPI0011F161EB|nr:lasso peptide biosynthesis B2 protein [Dyadobacter sp. UC 10]KAA0989420.1 lasso peptide biosynthesis B2 protein [Dyadobacter sp. UC 10]
MQKLSRFIGTWRKLPGPGKLTFVTAAVSLLLIRVGLAVLPFSMFRKVFHWLTQSNANKEMSKAEIDQAVWAVDTAANLLPFELLCLPRALATKYLLRKLAALTLEIGIEINPNKAFEAHAWVERNGTIIIGHWPNTISYKRLWVWE